MSTPEEQKRIYPPFLVREFERSREDAKNQPQFITNDEELPSPPTKITDFLQLIRTTWVISNKDYQERFWVRQEPPMQGDNYCETTMTFEEDAEAVLDAKDEERVSMTDEQRKMLTKLLRIVEEYDCDQTTPLSRYGENDEAIVADPRWEKVRQYAKEVYEVLTGDNLDEWEKKRPQQAQPLKIERKKVTPEEMEVEVRKIYPPFLIQQFEKELPDCSLHIYLYHLFLELWIMSNKEYQERFWVRKEFPIYDDENCMKALASFLNDAQTILLGNERNDISLTSEEQEMLQKLYKMVEGFKNDPTTPKNPGYGLNDVEIIKDPKWEKIRACAKEAYEMLTGDTLV